MKNIAKQSAAILVSLFILVGCFHDDDDNTSSGTTPTPVIISGVFIDDAVQGLTYESSATSGVTDAQGTYECVDGEGVTFSVGAVTLGTAACSDLITPVDLVPGADTDDPIVQAIASFLQSLDGDGDPNNGVITITAEVLAWVEQALADLGLTSYNFTTDDIALADQLTQAVVALSTSDSDATNDLTYVSPTDATSNLEVVLAELGIFRKNISKTPELASNGATIEVMDVDVAPIKADGSDATICDSENNCITPETVNPLLTFYLDEEATSGNNDAWAAVSLDHGASWRRMNLSRHADKSVAVGDNPFGNVGSVNATVEGDKVFVTWISTYCPSGNPMDLWPVEGDLTVDPAIPPLELSTLTLGEVADPTVFNAYDLYKVAGSQGVADYTDPADGEMFFPGAGMIAYHCMWAARGVHEGDTDVNENGVLGDIVWYAPEQLTSARRDAKVDMPGSATNADGTAGGFAVTWQEDPDGLLPGQGAGPGVGWSGATAHSKTDIWYSYIDLNCFGIPATDTETVVDGCFEIDYSDTTLTEDGKPKPKYRMSGPVPVSDNNNCVFDDAASSWNAEYCQAYDNDVGTVVLSTKDNTGNTVDQTFALSGNQNPMCAVDNIDLSPYWDDADWDDAIGTLQTQCTSFNAATNSVPLDGDTAATRANLHLIYDEAIDGVRALVTYEEQKVLQFLCAEDIECEDTRLDLIGKYVIYETFPFMQPDVVQPGGILSTLTTTYEDTDADGIGDTVMTASDGTELRYIFENARRERVAKQTAAQAGSRDLRMLMIYKYGIFRQGKTSDLLIRRACGGYELEDWGSCAAVEPVDRDPICITCVSVTETEETGGTGVPKATDWIFEYVSDTDNNLYMDPFTDVPKSVSSYNPLDDARSLRSALMGDMVLIGFAWTPNWAAAAQQFTDKYDFFVRRSFDGGFSWTNAAGDINEGPVNVSNLPNAQTFVVEPRLVVQGGCRLDNSTGAFTCTDADGVVQTVDSIPFVATYCTAVNQEREGDDGTPIHAPGLDCYFALSPDNGDTYFNNRDVDGDETTNVALLAINHDTVEEANECDEDGTLTGTDASYCDGEEGFDWLARGPQEQVEPDLRLVPSLVPEYTHTLHGVWVQNGELSEQTPQDGSDAWYRRVDYLLQ